MEGKMEDGKITDAQHEEEHQQHESKHEHMHGVKRLSGHAAKHEARGKKMPDEDEDAEAKIEEDQELESTDVEETEDMREEDRHDNNDDNNDDNSDGKDDFKITKKGLWKATAIILALFLAVSVYFNVAGNSSVSGIPIDAASSKAIRMINTLMTGADAELLSSGESNGVYRLDIKVNNQTGAIYITKDGKLLFPTALELDRLPQQQPQQQAQPSGKEGVDAKDIIGDAPVKGNASAKVTIVEFSDFQCPFCGKYYSQTYKRLEKEYIETGKVRYAFRNFPLSFHEDSEKAAEASLCAEEQGKYWEMHNTLFENQEALGERDLKGYAQGLGLDTARFNECLDSGKYKDRIDKDIEEGQAYGVTGTPAFFVDGRFISGAQPYEVFKKIIDEELAR